LPATIVPIEGVPTGGAAKEELLMDKGISEKRMTKTNRLAINRLLLASTRQYLSPGWLSTTKQLNDHLIRP
jgi:hypothetical protein